jgi:hypothetical protein
MWPSWRLDHQGCLPQDLEDRGVSSWICFARCKGDKWLLLHVSFVSGTKIKILQYTCNYVIVNLWYLLSLKLRVIRQTANARQRKILRYQAIKSKWTCRFKTEIHHYSFDARKKICNENVQPKYCQESSNLPFAVPGNVKLKLPNNSNCRVFKQSYFSSILSAL